MVVHKEAREKGVAAKSASTMARTRIRVRGRGYDHDNRIIPEMNRT